MALTFRFRLDKSASCVKTQARMDANESFVKHQRLYKGHVTPWKDVYRKVGEVISITFTNLNTMYHSRPLILRWR